MNMGMLQGHISPPSQMLIQWRMKIGEMGEMDR